VYLNVDKILNCVLTHIIISFESEMVTSLHNFSVHHISVHHLCASCFSVWPKKAHHIYDAESSAILFSHADAAGTDVACMMLKPFGHTNVARPSVLEHALCICC